MTSAAGTPPITKQPVSRGWIARYGLMYLGQNIAWAAPSQLLLANQILLWYPDNKEAKLAILFTLGGIMKLIGSPVAGALSDRTRSRIGRRPPWIIAGAIAAGLALLTAAFAGAAFATNPNSGFRLTIIAWMCFQFSIALTITPAQAVAPDRVPQNQFGTVSGVMGLTYTIGVVLGTVVGGIGGVPAYIATVAIFWLAPLPFLLTHPEPADLTPPEDAPKPALKDLFPRSADFWWMFVTRWALTLGQAIALFYLLYFLRDRIHYADPDTGVIILTGAFAVCVMATAVWSGAASDKAGARKPFVIGASLGVAAACVLMATVTTFPLVVVAAVILGLSWGVYQAIDQALVNQVLPSETDRASHMGVMNLAVALPNTMAAVVAGIAVTRLGGYPGLYLLAAGLALLGTITVTRIKGSR